MNRTKKSMILSVVFMGLGQLYNKDYVKGILFSLVEVFFILKSYVIMNSIYGLITLGEIPQKFVDGVIKQGDNSIYLLINGAITLIVIAFFIMLYIYNVKDVKKTVELIEKGKKPLTLIPFIKNILDKNFPQIMITPAFIGIVIFTILPILFTVLISFTNYSSPNHLPPRGLVDWVGFKNYINIVKLDIWNSTFIKVAIWTLIWASISTVLNYVAGMFMAILISYKGIKFKKFWRTILMLPYAIPAFVSLLVFRLGLSGPGPINGLLGKIGISQIPFFTDPLIAKIMIILINLWLGAPYFMILMSGILTNIDDSLYEAADIDGANWFHKFKGITFPMVLFQTAPVLIMTFAYNFNNFNIIYLLTDGNPVNANFQYAGSTDILITWVFKMTNDQGQYHMASVVAIILFVFIAGLSMYSLKKTKSFEEEDMM